MKPEELEKDLIYGKNLSLLPDMKIEFEGKQDPVKLDNPSVRKHYERLLTWLDLQLITKGLLFIRDSDDHTKYDPDFQKLAIVNTWYNMSKTSMVISAILDVSTSEISSTTLERKGEQV